MRYIFAILTALTLVVLPLATEAAGNTYQLNVLLSPELNGGGQFEVTTNSYNKVDGGDLTTYAVANIQGYIGGLTTQWVAVGAYSNYAGVVGYVQSTLPVTCYRNAFPTNSGHGCQMAVSRFSYATTSDRVSMFVIDSAGDFPQWYFYVRDDTSGIYQGVGWVDTGTTYPSLDTPMLQESINYQGLIYAPGNNKIQTLFMQAQGYSLLNNQFQDFASGTTQIKNSNPADSLACSNGILGFIPYLDPNVFAAGHVNGSPQATVINWLCGGYQLWPTLSGPAQSAPKGTKMAKKVLPRESAPTDQVTRINLYPSESGVDQYSVGLTLNGHRTVVQLLPDPARSQDAFASWLKSHPEFNNATQLWMPPERHLLELDPTSPYALTLHADG